MNVFAYRQIAFLREYFRLVGIRHGAQIIYIKIEMYFHAAIIVGASGALLDWLKIHVTRQMYACV